MLSILPRLYLLQTIYKYEFNLEWYNFVKFVVETRGRYVVLVPRRPTTSAVENKICKYLLDSFLYTYKHLNELISIFLFVGACLKPRHTDIILGA